MNKYNKIILSFYIFLAFSYGVYVLTSNPVTETDKPLKVTPVTPNKITYLETSRLVDINNERIFNVMSDIENFPDVLPKNIVSVQILNKTENVIFAEEEITEAGIKMKLQVKHTIDPFNEHIIEILDGDAKGTTISQSFEPIGSQTNIITKVHLNVRGIAALVKFLPENNLIHATNTVVSHFVNYAKFDMYDEKVNALYKEILNRPVDQEGIDLYSNLLRDKKITEEELRYALFNSPERISMEKKSVEELSDETKDIINDLHEKILLRKAGPEGIIHFGNLLESGTHPDEIRTMLLESDEGKGISLTHPIRGQIQNLYGDILDKKPTYDELNYYHKLIDDGLMTIDDVEKDLMQTEEYKNLNK